MENKCFYRIGLLLISEDYEGEKAIVFSGDFKKLTDAFNFYQKQKNKVALSNEKLSAEIWDLTYDAETGELIHSSMVDYFE